MSDNTNDKTKISKNKNDKTTTTAWPQLQSYDMQITQLKAKNKALAQQNTFCLRIFRHLRDYHRILTLHFKALYGHAYLQTDVNLTPLWTHCSEALEAQRTLLCHYNKLHDWPVWALSPVYELPPPRLQDAIVMGGGGNSLLKKALTRCHDQKRRRRHRSS